MCSLSLSLTGVLCLMFIAILSPLEKSGYGCDVVVCMFAGYVYRPTSDSVRPQSCSIGSHNLMQKGQRLRKLHMASLYQGRF